MLAALLTAAMLAGAAANSPACQPLPLAQRWLATQQPRWQSTLQPLAGYHRPAHVQICALHARRPHADPAASRIYVAPLRNSNDAVSLVHEYLHLAFAGHPHGRDETFIETLARRLVREGVQP